MLYLLPGRRRHSDWCRSLLKAPAIRLRAGGIEASAEAKPVGIPRS
jgi:hypothetical protein